MADPVPTIGSHGIVAPSAAEPCILIYAVRDRAKTFVKNAFPKRKARTLPVRTFAEFERYIRRELIDAVVVDLAADEEDAWSIAGQALDFPSMPFFGVIPAKPSDAPLMARAVQLGFADFLVETVDNNLAFELVQPLGFSARFAKALATPPPALGLTTATQLVTWQAIINFAGRPITTTTLAAQQGVSREHLSRSFVQGNKEAPNLKRIIDLVRLLAAAELCKNPGYDIRDVADVLGFATPSHFAVTTHRIASTRPPSLASLRTVDLVERFLQGRMRSRKPRAATPASAPAPAPAPAGSGASQLTPNNN